MDQTPPGAADDRVFDAILLSARARTADLQRAYDAKASGGNLGCGIPPDLDSWHRLARTWHDAVRAIREIEGIVTVMVAPLAKDR